MKRVGLALDSLVARELPRIVGAATPFRLVRRVGRPRKGFDLSFELSGDGFAVPVWVELNAHPRVADVDGLVAKVAASAEKGAVYMLVTPHLDRPVRSGLRAAGISHADLGGNLFVRAPGVIVSVDAPAGRIAARARREEINPFADKASLVVRALLRDAGRAWGIRELAGELGISPGMVSRTGEVIVRRGYALKQGGKLALGDAAAVLVDWIAVRPWSRNELRSFVAPFEADELRSIAWETVERLAPGAVLTQLAGLEAYASNVVGQSQVHVYCRPELVSSAGAVVAAALHAQPVRRGGNLHLVMPALRRSAFFDARIVGGMRVVSPVQLFLDLAGYPLRGGEAAEMLLRSTLGPELRLDGEQRARIARTLEAL